MFAVSFSASCLWCWAAAVSAAICISDIPINRWDDPERGLVGQEFAALEDITLNIVGWKYVRKLVTQLTAWVFIKCMWKTLEQNIFSNQSKFSLSPSLFYSFQNSILLHQIRSWNLIEMYEIPKYYFSKLNHKISCLSSLLYDMDAHLSF